MPSLFSYLCAWAPGVEKLYQNALESEDRRSQKESKRRHFEQMEELRRRAERASAERNAVEAEHDRLIYVKALEAPIADALAILSTDCDLERQLIERSGLRRVRETIFSAELPPQAVAQVLSGLSPSSNRLAAPLEPADPVPPGLAPSVEAESIERLAMLFVTRVGSASDPAERDRLFSEWREELRRQLPRFQADEVEARVRHLLHLVS